MSTESQTDPLKRHQPGESLSIDARGESGLRFHYTVGSGSSRKAIGTAALAASNPTALDDADLDALLTAGVDVDSIPHPEYAMLSYARRDNRPFEGPKWFIDSGGYSVQKKFHEYPTSIDAYVQYLLEHEEEIELYALRDWACEPSLLRDAGRSVRTHQEWTIRDHVYCLEAAEDAGLNADPVAVIQGHDLEEYIWAFEYLQEHGLASSTLGVGSILRPHKTSEVRTIIQGLREAIPAKYDLHGFGISKTVLEDPATYQALDSADTTSWHAKAVHARVTDPEWADRVPAWVRTLQAYIGYHNQLADLAAEHDVESTGKQEPPRVVTLGSFTTETTRHHGVEDPLIECICGNLLDPNRDLNDNSMGCRFCEQRLLELWDRKFQED
jgi:hypothetical protein